MGQVMHSCEATRNSHWRIARSYPAILILVLSLGVPVSGRADDDIFETRTVNGHKFELSQVGQGDYRARVDGKEVFTSGPPKAELSFEGVHSGDGKEYIVLSRASENCPARMFAIDLSGAVPLVSKPMGNCSEQSKIDVVGGALQVTSPAKTGSPVVTTFLSGQTLPNRGSTAALQASFIAQAVPSSHDIVYPDLPEPGSRVVFQRSGETDPTKIEVKQGNSATTIQYNGVTALRLREQDYPRGIIIQGPIVGPASEIFELDKPLTIQKGSPVYVMVVAATGIAACTQNGFIMDVTGHIPVMTSKLHLCPAELPRIGIDPDGSVEVLVKSWKPSGPDSFPATPAQRYVFKTGDANFVRTNFPAGSTAEAAKIDALTDARVQQELDANPYNRPDPFVDGIISLFSAANKGMLARQEYCRNHIDECREEAQREADMQERISRSQQQYQEDYARRQSQYQAQHDYGWQK